MRYFLSKQINKIMAKGVITKNLDNSKYQVKILTDTTAIKERIKALDAQITAATTAINITLKIAIDTAKAELDAIDITAKNTGTSDKLIAAQDALSAAQTAQADEQAVRQIAVNLKASLQTQLDNETDKDIIDDLKKRIADCDKQISASNAKINGSLQTAVDKAAAKLAMVKRVNPEKQSSEDAFQSDLLKRIGLTHKKLDDANQAMAQKKIERQSAIDEKNKLELVPDFVEKELWSVDLTTDIEIGTTVGIIDLYQARKPNTVNRPLIVPAYIDAIPENRYNPVRDGRLVPAFTLEPHAWYYALAVATALERANPRYRKGTITYIYNLEGAELQAAITAANATIATETATVNAVTESVATKNDAIVSKTSELNALNEQLKALKAAANSTPAQITAKQQDITKKQDQIDALTVELNALQYDLENAQSDLRAAISHLNALNDGDSLCNVDIDANYTQILTKDAKPLSKKELHLKQVPVRYLSCDCRAFAKGDRVVLEYPRKNLHKQFLNMYSAKKQALISNRAKKQQDIDTLTITLNAKQKEIDDLQKIADDTVKIIKDEADNAGITALQEEIDALDLAIIDYDALITSGVSDKASAESNISNASQQVTSLNDQLDTLNAELQALIASGGSSADILAKETEINAKTAELNTATQALQDANQARANAVAQINTNTTLKLTALSDRSKRQDAIFPLLSKETIARQDLKHTLESIAIKTDELRKIQDHKFAIEQLITNVTGQLIRFDTLIGQEQNRYDKLKKYTDTRPQEITIVGFESNPRPCPAVFATYQDFKSPQVGNAADQSPYSWGKRDRPIYLSSNLSTDTPPRFMPKIKTDFYAGNKFWVSNDDQRVISWYKDTVYIDGNAQVMLFDNPTPPLVKNEIVCACLASNNAIIFVEYDFNNKVFYLNISGVSRVIFAGNPRLSKLAFKTDCKTLIALEYTDFTTDIAEYVFNSDYSDSTKTVLVSRAGHQYQNIRSTTEVISYEFHNEANDIISLSSPAIDDIFINKDVVTVLCKKRHSYEMTDSGNSVDDGDHLLDYTSTMGIPNLTNCYAYSNTNQSCEIDYGFYYLDNGVLTEFSTDLHTRFISTRENMTLRVGQIGGSAIITKGSVVRVLHADYATKTIVYLKNTIDFNLITYQNNFPDTVMDAGSYDSTENCELFLSIRGIEQRVANETITNHDIFKLYPDGYTGDKVKPMSDSYYGYYLNFFSIQQGIANYEFNAGMGDSNHNITRSQYFHELYYLSRIDHAVNSSNILIVTTPLSISPKADGFLSEKTLICSNKKFKVQLLDYRIDINPLSYSEYFSLYRLESQRIAAANYGDYVAAITHFSQNIQYYPLSCTTVSKW